MYHFDYAAFIQAETLGGLCTGSLMVDFSNKWGEPDAVSDMDRKFWQIVWRYENMQITFLNSIATGIGFDVYEGFALPRFFHPTEATQRAGNSRAKILCYLRDKLVPFSLAENGKISLENSRAFFSFDEDDDEDKLTRFGIKDALLSGYTLCHL